MKLKPWFASNAGLALPLELDLPPVRALSPYAEQVAALDRQIGAALPRQTMKDASGASMMDAKTQVTSLHAVTMLDAALKKAGALIARSSVEIPEIIRKIGA